MALLGMPSTWRVELIAIAQLLRRSIYLTSESIIGRWPILSVDELFTVVLIVVVGAVTTAALYLGLLGLLGAVHIVRCASCNHWTFSSADGRPCSCPRCRHLALSHPLHAAGRPRHLKHALAIQKRDEQQ